MIQLLPLCGSGKLASRDGDTGPFAMLPLLGYSSGNGFFFFDGKIGTFPEGEQEQNQSPTLRPVRQANTFVKAAGICTGGL